MVLLMHVVFVSKNSSLLLPAHSLQPIKHTGFFTRLQLKGYMHAAGHFVHFVQGPEVILSKAQKSRAHTTAT
jgi:hypothetical protein